MTGNESASLHDKVCKRKERLDAMEGKGWFVIYGLLVFFAFYLFFSQREANNRVEELEAQVAALQADTPEATLTPEPSDSPEPNPSTSPDLGTTQSRDTQRKEDVKKIRQALSTWRKERKTYPAELKELSPQYLAELPVDPLSPKFSYRFRRSSANSFILTSVLESKDDPEDTSGVDTKRDGVYTLTEKSP